MARETRESSATATFVTRSGRGAFIAEEPITTGGMPPGQHVWVRWDVLEQIVSQGGCLLRDAGRASRAERAERPELDELQAMAEALRGESCRRGELLALDAFVAVQEAEKALKDAKDALALAAEVRREPMSGELFAKLLELELREPPRLTWSRSSHPTQGVRFIGRGDNGYRALVYLPRSGIQTWTWSLYHRGRWNVNGEALSALQGAFSAETEFRARCPDADGTAPR